MSLTNSISPVGWYVGSYLIRFIEIDAANNNDPEERFHSWENTVIVKAKDLEEAYAKVLKIAEATTTPYRGGDGGVLVRWVFEGVTDLLPIYEELDDGAEIMWKNNKARKLKNLQSSIRSHDELLLDSSRVEKN